MEFLSTYILILKLFGCNWFVTGILTKFKDQSFEKGILIEFDKVSRFAKKRHKE